MIRIEDFSRKATSSAREAMAITLANRLAELEFRDPGGSVFRFASVFYDWPSYSSKYVPPSACVLPGSWVYANALMTPTLCEDTWEPKGESGFGLYKLSELEVEFEVSLRTDSTAQRDTILLGLESAFQPAGLLMTDPQGSRYGLLLPMPEYYGMQARFALQGARVIDDEERAMREQRDAVVVISGQAAQVVVGPVFPLGLTVRLNTC
jgi:hypothetical protein